MDDKFKLRVEELLTSGRIEGFVGLREEHGHIAPHLFTRSDDLAGLALGDRQKPGDTRYPLNQQLITLSRYYPDKSFGVLVRGCDERGLKVLFASNQLDSEKVVSVGIACPQELADACGCRKPFPDEFVSGEPAESHPSVSVRRLDALDLDERLKFWTGEFARCIQCYGCRDICPMCYCRECSLGGKDLFRISSLPPESPIFHHTRALHMIGRCVDCGLCEEACPADIPLRALYKKIADIIDEKFHYRPGYGDPAVTLSQAILAKH